MTIRREVRRVEESSNSAIVGGDALKTTVAPVRLTSCDQMLIKFYLKHIEENLNELSKIEQVLIDKLNLVVENNNNNNSADSEGDSPMACKEVNQALEVAHKFAIGGHKLVFICDTLQRNINNLSLKQALIDTSNSLSAALKVYMIRLKISPTSSSSTKPEGEAANKSGDSSSAMFKNLILNAISSVLTCADEFKSIILKYYFKSF